MKIRSGVTGAVVFLTVFLLVLVAGAGAVEIKGKKGPALPGKQASDVITATGPDFTVYYVKNGAIKIKTKFMEEFAKTPVAKFVAEGNKKGTSIEDIVIKGQDAGHSPVDLLKGFIINGVPLQAVIKVYLEKNLLPPCGLMKGALEAVRGMKMVEVESGHYAIVTPGMCAIEGSMAQSDWDRLQKLMAEGLISTEELPHYPPEKEQTVAAGCCETLELAQVFLAAGADIEDLRACFSTMGCSGLGYSAPPPPPPAPATTLGTIESSPTQ
jgi:hypothetical protein